MADIPHFGKPPAPRPRHEFLEPPEYYKSAFGVYDLIEEILSKFPEDQRHVTREWLLEDGKTHVKYNDKWEHAKHGGPVKKVHGPLGDGTARPALR